MYYQSSYESQPYSSSYSAPYTYPSLAQQADCKAAGRPDGPAPPYCGPSADLAPVSTDLVKKRLRDR